MPMAKSLPAKKAAGPWLRLLGELSPRRRLGLALVSFIAPWRCGGRHYLPFLWHPIVRIDDPGGGSWFARASSSERTAFDNRTPGSGPAAAAGQRRAGQPGVLPAPHRVAWRWSPPSRRRRGPDEPWLHQSLWTASPSSSGAFFLSSLIGVPLGILLRRVAGDAARNRAVHDRSFPPLLPAPAFGALTVAVLGIHDAPKIAIIAIGTFFPQVASIANTTRRSIRPPRGGADARRVAPHLLSRVSSPASSPTSTQTCASSARLRLDLPHRRRADRRQLRITFFINQQPIRAYERVVRLDHHHWPRRFLTDVSLAWLGRRLFHGSARRGAAGSPSSSARRRPGRPRSPGRRRMMAGPPSYREQSRQSRAASRA